MERAAKRCDARSSPCCSLAPHHPMARAGLVLCRCPSSDRRRRAVDRYDRENVFKREFLPLEGVEVVIQPTVQAPPPADHQPSPAPRSRSLFRCIPCDCHTTLVHSPLLVFACSLSAGYFGVSLAFSLLLQNFGAFNQGEDLILVHCSDIFDAENCAADVDKEVAQAESAANRLHVTALVFALLVNNKWLKCQCTALPKTSLCALVAVCLLTGVMGLAAFIASTVEASACFSCKLVPDIQLRFENQKVDFVSLLSVMRFESFLGAITSLFLLIAVAWMALGRVPWITKLFRGHAYLTDHEASMIRHLVTSRVYIGLFVGLLVNIAVVIYFGSTLHGWLAIMDGWRSWLPDWLASILSRLIGAGVGAAMDFLSSLFGGGLEEEGEGESGGGEDINTTAISQAVNSMLLSPTVVKNIELVLVLPKSAILFGLILLYVQLAVCVLASAFNGWKHLQHWRTVTKVARTQVTPSPAEGISPAQPDGLDAEHSRLLDVGSKNLIQASRLPAFMCQSIACGSVIIALVVSPIITALYTWSAYKDVQEIAAPIVESIGWFVAVLIGGVLSRMVLVRCLFHPKQLRGGGEVWPMRRPICFAWYEAFYLVFAIVEGIWIGAKRLLGTFTQAVASLLRTDRPSHAEGRVANDVVFSSYAAVLCLERDAEASRRQAGATHFESGVLAVESDVSLKHTALWCLGWLCAWITPPIIYFVIVVLT